LKILGSAGNGEQQMAGLLKLLSVFVFFGLCWGAFNYIEDHQSTKRKALITKLEAKVEELRSEVADLSEKRNRFKNKILRYFPDTQTCVNASSCDSDMVCDIDLGICVATPEEEEEGETT
jgi:hypothetical protein